MEYHAEDRARLKKQRTEQAIALAMQSRWEEAATVNRELIELFPNDVDAHNRLGRALTELGRYAEARRAYERALELDPNSTIARRNVERLSVLGDQKDEAPSRGERVTPHLFIGEVGKTGFSDLHRPTSRQTLARMNPGDEVRLRAKGSSIEVVDAKGVYLGEVEPRLAQRLTRLMEAGNRYAAAITAVTDRGARIIIRETYQHPSLAGRPSFPPPRDDFRGYTRESLLRYELEDEEEEAVEESLSQAEDEEEKEEQEAEGPPDDRIRYLSDRRLIEAEKADEEDEEEI